MSTDQHGLMELGDTHVDPSTPNEPELRETTLQYTPSSPISNNSPTQSPQSATPLIASSHLGDIEVSSNRVSDYGTGYSRLAAFETCDPNFLICRKFSWLHSRLLLHLQDELSQLERELEREDEWEFNSGDRLKLRARRIDCKRPDAKRQVLLTRIHEKLKEYDELMFRLRDVQAIRRPSKRNQGSVYQEMASDASNIVDGEAQWIRRSDDLAALSPDADHGWFNVWLEDVLNKFSRETLLKYFRSNEQETKTGQIQDLNLVCPDRFDIVLKALLTLIAAGLLCFPVLILFKLQPTKPSEIKSRSGWQIFFVFMSTLTFSACCFLLTKARKQEVFTATAAYSAVLVIFLGNTSQMMMYPNSGMQDA